MYILLVRVDVKSEQKVAFLNALIDVTHTTRRTEPGSVVRFDVTQDSTDPNRLFVYEVWRDKAAFDTHLQAPYYKQFGNLTKAWLATPPTILCVGSNLYPPDGDEEWR